MPRLLLLRHAQPERLAAGQMDIDRPLSPAGRAEARRLGRRMAQEGWVPDRALCSPARRARDTLQAVLAELGGDASVEVSEERGLYDGMDGDYVGLLRRLGRDVPVLLAVGHFPAVRNSAVLFAPRTPDARLRRLQGRFPPAALAVLDFERPWSQLAPYAGRLAAFLPPEELA